MARIVADVARHWIARTPALRYAALACLVLLHGCASTPGQSPPYDNLVLPPPGTLNTPMPSPQLGGEVSVGSEIAIRAISLLGAPYKLGGSGPKVFDCSGLVSFVHEEIGIDVPRTAAEQYRAAAPVKLADIEPGDLLFFRISGKRISHVAIYAGSGRFIHAPRTGRPIELRALDDGYYLPRLAGAGRLF